MSHILGAQDKQMKTKAPVFQVQTLRSTAVEAIKNKEDTELKCQHKIADMVALMEKHKVRSS